MIFSQRIFYFHTISEIDFLLLFCCIVVFKPRLCTNPFWDGGWGRGRGGGHRIKYWIYQSMYSFSVLFPNMRIFLLIDSFIYQWMTIFTQEYVFMCLYSFIQRACGCSSVNFVRKWPCSVDGTLKSKHLIMCIFSQLQ